MPIQKKNQKCYFLHYQFFRFHSSVCVFFTFETTAKLEKIKHMALQIWIILALPPTILY